MEIIAASVAHPQWRAVQDMFALNPAIIGHCEAPATGQDYPRFRLSGIGQEKGMSTVVAFSACSAQAPQSTSRLCCTGGTRDSRCGSIRSTSTNSIYCHYRTQRKTSCRLRRGTRMLRWRLTSLALVDLLPSEGVP